MNVYISTNFQKKMADETKDEEKFTSSLKPLKVVQSAVEMVEENEANEANDLYVNDKPSPIEINPKEHDGDLVNYFHLCSIFVSQQKVCMEERRNPRAFGN